MKPKKERERKTSKFVIRATSWDWKDSIDVECLNSMIKAGCRVFYQPNTESDDYALIGASEKLHCDVQDLWEHIEQLPDWSFWGKDEKDCVLLIKELAKEQEDDARRDDDANE